MQSAKFCRDLDVLRSCTGGYADQYEAILKKGNTMSGAIRRAFRQSSRKLLWPAFSSYVIPVVTYCSPAWNPVLKKDIIAIEKIQRKFTKHITGLNHLPYLARVRQLGVLTLENRRIFSDMVVVYSAIHGQSNCSTDQLGLVLANCNTRGRGRRLVPGIPKSVLSRSLFCNRVPPIWNCLPDYIINRCSLSTFKRCLKKYLLSTQTF